MTYSYHGILIALYHNLRIFIENWFDLGQHSFARYILHLHIF